MLGSVTFQNTSQSEAPSVRAASSSAMSMASRMGISSRTTNGNVTNSVASAMPAVTPPVFNGHVHAHEGMHMHMSRL